MARRSKLLLPEEARLRARRERGAQVCFWIAGILTLSLILLALIRAVHDPFQEPVGHIVDTWMSHGTVAVLLFVSIGLILRRS